MAAFFMMYTVYILYSQSLDVFYKGQTSNLMARVQRHNKKSEKSTKLGVPWNLIWSTSKVSRSEAIKLERKLKNLSRRRTLDFMLKFYDDIQGHDEALLIQRLS